MQVGVIFPQTEIGPDPGAIREYAQAVESLGYSHVFIADHVLGADPSYHEHVRNHYYTHQSVMHEPFSLMGYLSAITRRIGLMTGILILPQRQTALAAKQAAEVDVLSGGRLRLGIGVGWNHVEYEALGQDFHTRGRRSAEQIEVLRALWTQESVSYQGRWHHITDAGINPLPVQRPIPIWMGVGSSMQPSPSDVVLKRVARLADGWCPSITPNQEGRDVVSRLNTFMAEYGRDPASLGFEGRLRIAGRQPDEWAQAFEEWKEMGVTHLAVEARRGGLASAEEHIQAIRRFKEVVEF